MLQKHGLPGLGHELYEQRPAGYDDKGQEINKSAFKASKKHPGYYTLISVNKQYDNDEDLYTQFYKVGANGKMKRVGYLNK